MNKKDEVFFEDISKKIKMTKAEYMMTHKITKLNVIKGGK